MRPACLGLGCRESLGYVVVLVQQQHAVSVGIARSVLVRDTWGGQVASPEDTFVVYGSARELMPDNIE